MEKVVYFRMYRFLALEKSVGIIAFWYENRFQKSVNEARVKIKIGLGDFRKHENP